MIQIIPSRRNRARGDDNQAKARFVQARKLAHDFHHVRTVKFRRALSKRAGTEFNDNSFLCVFHILLFFFKLRNRLINYH